MRLLAGSSWGAQKRSLVAIYRALVRSVLEYGLEVFHFAPQKYLIRLERIQACALRICCGAMRSTPICALQAACKEMPLDLRHQYLSLRFKNKIMGSNNHPCRDVYSDSKEQESGRRTFFKSVHCITTSSMPQLTEIATNYPSLLLQTAPWTIEAPRIDMALDSIRRELPPTRQLLAAEYINSQFSEY